MFFGIYLIIYNFVLFLPQVKTACLGGYSCREPRDVIYHSEDQESTRDNPGSGYLQWRIEPTLNHGNILLAFKNFSTNENGFVQLIFYKTDGKTVTRTLRKNLKNFEVLTTKTRMILVNTTVGAGRTRFTLHYYADCQTTKLSPIRYDRAQERNRKCWIITPRTPSPYNRIYLNIRNLKLPAGMKLTVRDIHSSNLLSDISENTKFKNISFESAVSTKGRNSYSMLLDFVCDAGRCDYGQKQYLFSHYAMREQDIQCIEAVITCRRNKTIAKRICNNMCPALSYMIQEEHLLEYRTRPTINVKGIDQVEQICPLPKRFCQCNFLRRDWKYYCKKTTKCLKLVGCRWNCIYYKMQECKKLKIRGQISFF